MVSKKTPGSPQVFLVFAVLALCEPSRAQLYVISTLAGGTPAPTPAPAASTPIQNAQSVAVDSSGNLYYTSSNSVFRMNTSGTVSLMAGNSRPGYSGDGGPAVNAQLNAPVAIAVDSAGDLYIADRDNNRVREVFAQTGIIVTVAGSGAAGYSGDGGPAVQAQLYEPAGVAVDSSGNLYIADTGNEVVREVTPDGLIQTFAGNGTAGYSGDGGAPTQAQLNFCIRNSGANGLAVDSSGDLYIADCANNAVREVSSGVIKTAAGTGTAGYAGDSGDATSANLKGPTGVALDSSGNLYIADSANQRIREVSSGTITTFAGDGTMGYSGDGGTATSAELSYPSGVAVNSSGDLFIADLDNERIREVVSSNINTVAGVGSYGYAGDGGSALTALLNEPFGIARDSVGNLYVADFLNNRIREISSGTITTIAGNGTLGYSGDGGQAVNAEVSSPSGVAVDPAGNIYIADTGNNVIRMVSNGVINTIAGNGTAGYSGDGGPAASAQLNSPVGVAVDNAGNVYIADSANNVVRMVTKNGNISTVAGTGAFGFAGDGGLAAKAALEGPLGVAVDSSGNLYIADTQNERIRMVSSNGVITTIAGSGQCCIGGDGGAPLSAELGDIRAIAVDHSGNVYVSQSGFNRIRKIPVSGTVTTIAGSGAAGYSGDGGAGAAAQIFSPGGIVSDAAGNVYFADRNNDAIRELQPVSQTTLISAVFDAASESPIPVSPGKLVVIYGTGLGPAQFAAAQPSGGVFASQLAGTTVTFNGIPAPLLYTFSSQLAAIAPYELTGSTAQVVVSYMGQTSNTFQVQLAAAAPSIFTANGTGAGQAAAVNLNGTLNSASNPVAQGSYVSLYATGAGLTTPSSVDGQLAVSPYPKPILPVSVTIGGQPATVGYAGAAPGEVAGLMQINVLIPASVTPGGYVPVVLQVGNNSTVNGAVWIAVSSN